MISAQGVDTDPAKVSWPCPCPAKELPSFLGLSGYYRMYVHNFSLLSKPLTCLLKKQVFFIWTTVQDWAFQAQKDALCSLPVLKLSIFSRPFAIAKDVYATRVGVVLTQDGHPISFISNFRGP